MIEIKNIYWIGGSPCSGKSTIAELLVKEFKFQMYKCDDHLERYMDIGASKGSAIMKKFKSMNLDETWLRDPDQQVEEEFEFYRVASNIIMDDLARYNNRQPILVEGAAITPELMNRIGTVKNHYVSIVPTKAFQLEKYSHRKSVGHYLSGCSNPSLAFENWMERDARFADIVKREAAQYGMNLIVTDGIKPIKEIYSAVKLLFGLAAKEE